eukprot:5408-Eustigmatos_ZCMA.PRE.1
MPRSLMTGSYPACIDIRCHLNVRIKVNPCNPAGPSAGQGVAFQSGGLVRLTHTGERMVRCKSMR